LLAVQVPLPSQKETAANVEPSHFAFAQVTVSGANPAQLARSFPSQLFALHSSAPVSQAAREPCGAPTTAVQVPREVPTSQASHCPSQALSQQTPSAQNPLPQSLGAVQLTPARFLHVPEGLHVLPASHAADAQQTPSTQNPVLHALPDAHAIPRSS
jgi:hypothetical protein